MNEENVLISLYVTWWQSDHYGNGYDGTPDDDGRLSPFEDYEHCGVYRIVENKEYP